jgi:hypothetical protein
MRSRIRQLPSPALVISAIALIFAVGGGTFALAITAQKTRKIARQVSNTQITKRAPGLSVNHAQTANSADNATNATNASQLGGIPASGYTQRGCGPLTGQIKGFARIAASASFSATFTTNGVEVPYNCSGGTVEARRTGLGGYQVRFNGSPVAFATASVLFAPPPASVAASSNVVVQEVSAGLFNVYIYNSAASSFVDDSFVIITP